MAFVVCRRIICFASPERKEIKASGFRWTNAPYQTGVIRNQNRTERSNALKLRSSSRDKILPASTEPSFSMKSSSLRFPSLQKNYKTAGRHLIF